MGRNKFYANNSLIKLCSMTCIFCENDFFESPIEHIIPESLGNEWYLLPKNTICATCNTRFSAFENKAIYKTHLGFIRIKNGIQTKKGKPSKFEINNIKGTGHPSFKKNKIKLEGMLPTDMHSFNPQNGSYKITIPDFDKSEMATSKFLLKMAYESLYKSQRKLFDKYDFSEIKNYLTKTSNKNWPFITSHNKYYNFKSIPSYSDKYNLGKIYCSLGISEISKNTLLFNFQYDYLNLTINLNGRDYFWSKLYFENDPSTSLYPRYLKKE